MRHTSASLVIQENADPDVMEDLETFFSRLVPEEARHYRHTVEGPDDMPAHIRAALTQVSLSIPVIDGELALGTWQGIYLFEHRSIPHRRSVVSAPGGGGVGGQAKAPVPPRSVWHVTCKTILGLRQGLMIAIG